MIGEKDINQFPAIVSISMFHTSGDGIIIQSSLIEGTMYCKYIFVVQ